MYLPQLSRSSKLIHLILRSMIVFSMIFALFSTQTALAMSRPNSVIEQIQQKTADDRDCPIVKLSVALLHFSIKTFSHPNDTQINTSDGLQTVYQHYYVSAEHLNNIFLVTDPSNQNYNPEYGIITGVFGTGIFRKVPSGLMFRMKKHGSCASTETGAVQCDWSGNPYNCQNTDKVDLFDWVYNFDQPTETEYQFCLDDSTTAPYTCNAVAPNATRLGKIFNNRNPEIYVGGIGLFRASHYEPIGQTTPECALDIYDVHYIYDGISDSRDNLSASNPENGAADPRECPINGCVGKQGTVGDPVNTQTGVFDYSYIDLIMPTLAGPLSFQRTYISSALDEYGNPLYDSTLGYGWTHNHDIRLILPTITTYPREIWFKATTANQYRFNETAAGVFQPDPGVLATLTVETNGNYTLIDSAKNEYIFNSAGRILTWLNYTGYGFNYAYNDQNGSLVKITAPDTDPDSDNDMFLEFTYTPNGNQITTTVSDQTGRSVSFVNTAGTLTVATDVMGQTWNYDYNPFKQLTTIQDPRGVIVLRNVYDDRSRVIEQYDGNNTKIIELAYNDSNNQTTIYDANQNATIHTYNPQKELVNQIDALNQSTTIERDDNSRPTSIVNPANNDANMIWSADGVNLLSFTDAEENLTTREYDTLNNLTKVIDPLGKATTYTYDGKLMTSSKNARNEITTYTYTTAADAPQPVGLLKTVIDPMGKTTSYEYDVYGNRIQMIDSLNRVTQYQYDSLGRLENTISPEGLITHNEYDLAGRIARTTRNYNPGYPKNYESMYNIVSEYGYDPAGNQIAATNTLGYTTLYTYRCNGKSSI